MKIITASIETKSSFLEMKVKRVFEYALKLISLRFAWLRKLSIPLLWRCPQTNSSAP